MHELSICNALIDQVERITLEHGARCVSRIVLKIGPLSGIEPGLLRQALPLAATATVAANAELVIDTADVVVCCSQCGSESTVAPNRLLCAACGDFRTRVISGDEMILQSLELEDCRPPHETASGKQARRSTYRA